MILLKPILVFVVVLCGTGTVCYVRYLILVGWLVSWRTAFFVWPENCEIYFGKNAEKKQLPDHNLINTLESCRRI